MGAFHFSLDIGLMKVLQENLELEIFVETGTFQGETLQAVSSYFREIHSVELSAELHELAASKFRNSPHIHLYQGNSAQTLVEIRSKISAPALYWLDAHWCVSDKTAGEKSQCPLLDELAALDPLRESDVVLIDDARLFLAPPHAPHEISDWPSFQDILNKFYSMRRGHHMMVLDDVIAIFPASVSESLKQYGAEHGVNLLGLLHKARHREGWEEKHLEAKKYADGLQQEFSGLLNYTKTLEAKLSNPVVRMACLIAGCGNNKKSAGTIPNN